MSSHAAISVDAFSSTVYGILQEYANAQTDVLDEGLREGAKTARAEWKANAPRDTGEYAGSIRFKKVGSKDTSPEYRVYSSDHYQLVHLLEKGHAKMGGGRVAARVHVAPAAEAGFERAYEAVREHYS